METIFLKLKEKYKAEFNKSLSKWWNGHAYFPLINYQLNYKYLKGVIKINYEFRQSEFTKPSMIDGGAFGDRHNCEINCQIETDKNFPIFTISERGFLNKLFQKNGHVLYKVKCNDKKMQNFLYQDKNLNDIFEIVENSPEFSPLIKGKMILSNYQINIKYNTQQKNESIINSINELCKNLIEYCER